MSKATLGSPHRSAPGSQAVTALGVGDRMLDFLRPDETGQLQAFYEYPRGKRVIFVVLAKLPVKPSYVAILDTLATRFRAISDVCLVALAPQSAEENAALKARLNWPFPLWSDDGTVTQALTQGTAQQMFRILVLDANLRIRGTFPNQKIKASPDSIGDAIDAILPVLRFPSPQPIRPTAPVLLVPDVFDKPLCQQLIKAHDRGKTFASGMVRTVDGKRQMLQEGETKRRVDLLVADSNLNQIITDLLVRRLLPELKKAFHFEPSRFEGFKIVRYDGKALGFFGPHRDNNTREVAKRRFALTLNLNSPETYSGGALRFPEYSDDLFRPSQAEALVFSCSHLHEVTPVTRGSRYVLITFFLK